MQLDVHMERVFHPHFQDALNCAKVVLADPVSQAVDYGEQQWSLKYELHLLHLKGDGFKA